MSITLPSGKVLHPASDLLSVSEDGELFEGYDAGYFEHNANLTASEQIELADIMIRRWTAFRNRLADQP